MSTLDQSGITQAVVDSFARCPDPRLRELVQGLVRHLHAFACEARITEGELIAAIAFLTRCGQISDDRRQEFILLSDVLGLSMLTVALNDRSERGCTESTVLGPFHVDDAPRLDLDDDIARGAKGAACVVRGTVRNLAGEPLGGATIDVWQSDEDGFYDVQYPELDGTRARGVFRCDDQGGFRFRSILPAPYPIPHDGPVGDLLARTARHPWRPAHLHFMIKAPGHRTLVTHLFRKGSDYLDSDAVFGVRDSLVATWLEQPDGTYLLEYDFVLDTDA